MGYDGSVRVAKEWSDLLRGVVKQFRIRVRKFSDAVLKQIEEKISGLKSWWGGNKGNGAISAHVFCKTIHLAHGKIHGLSMGGRDEEYSPEHKH